VKLGGWDFRASHVAAALLFVHAVLTWVNRAFVGGLWHDEAQYILLSRAVRRFSYSDFYLVGSPFDSLYPPGLPAIFAAVSLPFGEHAQLLIAAVLVCSVVGLWLVYDIVRRCDTPRMALLVLALAAVNPDLVQYGGHVLSEQPYMMFSMLALWAVVRESAQPPATASATPLWRRAPVVAMASAIVAALIRLIGVTVIGAVMIQWALERRTRRVLSLTAAGAVTVGAFVVWLIIVPPHIEKRSYVADATFSPRADFGVGAIIRHRVTTNIGDYVAVSLPRLLQFPSFAAVARRSGSRESSLAGAAQLDALIGFVVVVSLGAFGVWVLWRRARVVAVYIALYFVLLAFWSWHQSRYLIPVLPLMFWALFAAIVHVARLHRRLRYLPAVAVGGVLFMSVGRDLVNTRESLGCDRGNAMASERCFSPIERGFFAAMDFIRSSTADTAAFLTSADTQLGLFGGRRALFSAPLTGSAPDSVFAQMRARVVEYALLTPLRPPDDQLVPTFTGACRSVELVREFPAVTLVLRVPPPGRAPAPDACAALQRYNTEQWKSNLW